MQRSNFALPLALLASQTVWADLAIRYQFEFKFGPALPAAAADAAKAQLASLFPGGIATLVKGDKCASSFGPLNSIIDGGKGEITLLNPETKRFATIPQASYMEKVLGQQQVPAAAQQALQGLLQNLKIDVQMKQTGQSRTIQGIQAEEYLAIISMEMPNPAGIPLGFRMEMHEWLATAGELTRIPALNQIAGCSAGLGGSADPSAMIEKILGPLGGSNGLSDAVQKLAALKGKLALSTQVEVFAPALVAMMQAQGGAGAAPATDVNAPLGEISFELAELSTNPLPDTMFQVPAGYQEAPLEDLLQAIKPASPAQGQPPKAPVPIAAAAPIENFNGPTIGPGKGVSNPVPILRPEPKYTEDARRARIEGSVLLALVVDTNGAARNIKVVRSLDPGLDQMAVDALRQWTFRLGQRNGSPVSMQAQLEVNFRLLDKPDQQ
jgi:TonB family protein